MRELAILGILVDPPGADPATGGRGAEAAGGRGAEAAAPGTGRTVVRRPGTGRG